MKKLGIKLSLVSTLAWATACSQVAFSPGDQLESLESVDGYNTESFTFNDDGSGAKVDVLFVIDNSGSMREEQSKLSTALASFVGSIQRLDWQIGITTTDVSNGPQGIKGSLVPMKGTNQKVLTKNVPGYANIFKNTVVREETIGCTNNCPSGDERPMEAIRMAMEKKNTDNAGFFRDDSDLVTIVLSDEDEGSNGTNALSPSTVIDHFKSIFGNVKRLTGFGIIVRPGDLSCYNTQSQNGGNYGNVASNFASLTGGETGSICDSDYGPALASIGERVRKVSQSVTLRSLPKPETLQLRTVPADPDLTWTLEGQTIQFNKLPAKGTRVDIVYMPNK